MSAEPMDIGDVATTPVAPDDVHDSISYTGVGIEAVPATPVQIATTDQVAPYVRLLTHKMDALRRQIRQKEAAVARNKERLAGPNAPRNTQFLDLDPDLDPDSTAVRAAVSQLDTVTTATALNYSALERAVRASEKGSVLLSALEVKPGEGGVELDAEEKIYITELLGELKDLEVDVIQAEDQRINMDLRIMETQAELQKKLQDLSEKNEAVLAAEAAESSVGGGSATAVGTPRTLKAARSVEAKKKELAKEERKVQQMRIMIQRLLTVSMANKSGGARNPLGDKENLKMLLRCGKDLEQLRREEESAAAVNE